jgi:integrase
MKTNLTIPKIKRLRPKPADYTVWDKRIPHLGIRVRTNGSMRYIHVIKRNSKIIRTTIGDVKFMSLENARSKAEALNRGEGEDKVSKSAPLFGDYVRLSWWPVINPLNKPKTRDRDRQALDTQLLPTFGQIPLDALTKAHILNWFERYSRKSPGGANRVMDTLKSILNHAVKNGIIPRNPAKGIKLNPAKKMTRFLSEEERAMLLAVLDRCPKSLQPQADIVRLILFTGCRKGEILNLRHEEIGEDGVLHLVDSKTGPRKVWLGKEARAILARQPTSEGYVFPRPGHKDHSRGSIDNFWIKIRREAGIEDVRLHDLRHSFASHAIRQGVSLPVLSKLLGHSTITMTMRYVHLSNADIEAAAERIGNKIMEFLARKFPPSE